ncbi:MAG: hypothetical protein AAGD96_31440 [Chloroflexota bacterium]
MSQWLSDSQTNRQNRLFSAIENGSYHAILEQLTPAGFLIETDRRRTLIFPELPQAATPSTRNHSSPLQIPGQGLEDWLWFDLYQVAQFNLNAESNQSFSQLRGLASTLSAATLAVRREG